MTTDEIVDRVRTALAYLEDGARETGLARLAEVVGRPDGIYAVCVPPDVSDEPVRWCFVDEFAADVFAQLHGSGAFVTYEPIAYEVGGATLRTNGDLEDYAAEVGVDWGAFIDRWAETS